MIRGNAVIKGYYKDAEATGEAMRGGWFHTGDAAADSQDTLEFSARAGVQSMNEIFPLEKVDEAYERMMSGKARFRVVLSVLPRG